MKKQIIESNTEPNKNCLWLTPNGLKKYGKSGWEDLTNGSGSNGGEDKVFEIKVKNVQDSLGDKHPEFMINGIGWFRSSASGTDDTGWRIDTLNGEEWENKGETIREIFKDIESYNKLKLTQLISFDENTEIPMISTEELTYQLIDTNGMFAIMLYSKVYRNPNARYLLIAQINPDGTSDMSISLD